jgi:signal transduction histidine kinase
MSIGSRISLRRRVTLASLALGFVLSLLFAGAVNVVVEDYEYILASELLHGQADDYSLRIANHLPARLPQTHRLSGFRAGDAPRYAGFPPGVHEDPRNEDMHVGVFDTSAGRLVFVMDLSDIEQLERHLNLLLAAVVVLGTAIAGWLGWMFAGAALAPVARLAGAVEALPTRPAPTSLEANVSHDELGRLARAIDAYQQRLVEADAHEQAFFADASHELRTPLAVVQGVAEVLLDDPDADRAQAARLQRLERGVQELGDLLETMLNLARRTPLQAGTVDAAAFLREAAGSLATADRPCAIAIDAQGTLHLPRREAQLLLRGLMRRMVVPGTQGSLTLHQRDQRIDIRVDSDAPGASVTAQRSDTGRAAALVDRLAQRMGWRIEGDAGGVTLHLPHGT